MSFTIVQQTVGTHTTTGTCTASLSGVSSSNCLIAIPIALSTSGAFSLSSIVDSVDALTVGAAYANGTLASSNRLGTGVYLDNAPTAGSHTVTATFSTTVTSYLYLAEVNAGGTLSADVAAAIAVGSGTTLLTNSVTPTQNGDLLISILPANQNTFTYSAWTNGFTAADSYNTVAPQSAWAWLLQTTAAAVTSQATLSGSAQWAAQLVALKVSSSSSVAAPESSGSAIRMSGSAVRIGMAPLMMMPLGWIIERRRRLARKPRAEFVQDEKTGLMLPRDPK